MVTMVLKLECILKYRYLYDVLQVDPLVYFIFALKAYTISTTSMIMQEASTMATIISKHSVMQIHHAIIHDG